ncbi:MAG: hypothetical protein JRI68_28940 [Deltaproteobacteria bacterium]|nr:hypothetical protein [Deltaproteobacteria bacterium]
MRRITALGYLAPCLLVGAATALSCAEGTPEETGAGGTTSSGTGGVGGGGGGTGLTGVCIDDDTTDCYTGAPATENVGSCQSGTATCSDHAWGPCEGEVLPTTEICNGDDDNCDGSVDEGNPQSGTDCNTGEFGPCKDGLTECVDGEVACVTTYTPVDETCNGIDDDCNGGMDDGNPGGGDACDSGLPGPCAPGLMTCTEAEVQCVAQYVPVAETCDNIDNNCSGQVDEGNLCQSGYTCQNGTCVYICPYVYAHDGSGYVYETTIGGSGLCEEDGSGTPLRATRGRIERSFHPLWARLDNARVSWRLQLLRNPTDHTPVRGSVRAKLVAAEDELVYLRKAHLAVVEHPAGCEVFSSSAGDYRPIRRNDPNRLWALPSASMRLATRATWRDQVDVTEAVSVKNDEPVAFDRQVENTYELDFGAVSRPEQARLVIDGWKFRETRNLQPGSRFRIPRLEVLQTDGSWRVVRRLPTPRGDRKPVVVELGGVSWPEGRYRMRLCLGTHQRGEAMWYLDRVRLSEDQAQPVTVSRLEVAEAQLAHAGPPTLLHPDEPHRPRLSIDDGGGAPLPEHQVDGLLTRYGAVDELVAGDDDRLVVMDRGDGVELCFEGITPPAPDSEQSLFLVTELLYKPRVMVTESAATWRRQTVEPLPYAQRPIAHKPDAVSHQRYLRAYQQRRPGRLRRAKTVAS